MTNVYTQPNLHTPAPKKNRKGLKIAATVAGAALLFGMGAASSSAKTVEVEKVVEKRVDVPGPERVVTNTVEKKVEVTPPSCLTALSLSEQAFDHAADAMGAIQARDVAGLNAQTEKIKALSADLLAAKAECRSK